jgi:predicted enzyme related to lactoylglutathione lyase
MSHKNSSINYIEFPLTKIDATKVFYNKVFNWVLTDWGPNYISFDGAGVEGGFNGFDDAQVSGPGVLVVLYAENLSQKAKEVTDAGGDIIKPIYDFPGGKRFHFLDPNGNELAVWSE